MHAPLKEGKGKNDLKKYIRNSKLLVPTSVTCSFACYWEVLQRNGLLCSQLGIQLPRRKGLWSRHNLPSGLVSSNATWEQCLYPELFPQKEETMLEYLLVTLTDIFSQTVLHQLKRQCNVQELIGLGCEFCFIPSRQGNVGKLMDPNKPYFAYL